MIYDYGVLNIVCGRYQNLPLNIFWKIQGKNQSLTENQTK